MERTPGGVRLWKRGCRGGGEGRGKTKSKSHRLRIKELWLRRIAKKSAKLGERKGQTGHTSVERLVGKMVLTNNYKNK